MKSEKLLRSVAFACAPYAVLCLLLCGAIQMFGQTEMFAGKRVGVYISGKTVEFEGEYYMDMAQFLKQGEDRSQGENLKTEFLIRLGETWVQELQSILNAESVFFVNADVKKGKAFLKAYNTEYNSLEALPQAFRNTDIVIVLRALSLQNRNEQSIIIRSNRMITDRIRSRTAEMEIIAFDPKTARPLFQTTTCLDEHRSPKKALLLHFYPKESTFGLFLSRLFSKWWQLFQEGEYEQCK